MGEGYGKTILFGEHFVVYGLPAIAAAIGAKTIAEVERVDKPGVELIDDRPQTPGYKKEKAKEQWESINRILTFCGIDLHDKGVKISLGGDLVAASGIGASAASCVALARALNHEFNLGWSEEKINEAAYEGEKGYHGTPSGIDNTVATFGGVIWFQKRSGQAPNLIEKIKIKHPISIVIGNTGLTSSTSRVISDVRSLKERNPERFEKILQRFQNVVTAARESLIKRDLRRIGELMNENQSLLREIQVSCTELDELVETSLDNGAYGAKLTGTGRGGLMIALTPSRQIQMNVATAIGEKGYTVWSTSIGV